jgi:hypothetical protein
MTEPPFEADIRARLARELGAPTLGDWIGAIVVIFGLIALGFWLGRKSGKGAAGAAAAPKV